MVTLAIFLGFFAFGLFWAFGGFDEKPSLMDTWDVEFIDAGIRETVKSLKVIEKG